MARSNLVNTSTLSTLLANIAAGNNLVSNTPLGSTLVNNNMTTGGVTPSGALSLLPSEITDNSTTDTDVYNFAFANGLVDRNLNIGVGALVANTPFMTFTPIPGSLASPSATTTLGPLGLITETWINSNTGALPPTLTGGRDYTYTVDPTTGAINFSFTQSGLTILQNLARTEPEIVTGITLDIVNGTSHDLIDVVIRFIPGGTPPVVPNPVDPLPGYYDVNGDPTAMNLVSKHSVDSSNTDTDKIKMLPNQEVMFDSMNGSSSGGSLGLNVLKIIAGTPIATFADSSGAKINTIEVSNISLGTGNGFLISGTDFTTAITADGKATLSITAAGLQKIGTQVNIDEFLSNIEVKTTSVGGLTDSFVLNISFANGTSSATVDNTITNPPQPQQPGYYDVNGNVALGNNPYTIHTHDTGGQTDNDEIKMVPNGDVFFKSMNGSSTGGSIGLNVLKMSAGSSIVTFFHPDQDKKIASIEISNISLGTGNGFLISGTDFTTMTDNGKAGFSFTAAGLLKIQNLTNLNDFLSHIEIKTTSVNEFNVATTDSFMLDVSFANGTSSLTMDNTNPTSGQLTGYYDVNGHLAVGTTNPYTIHTHDIGGSADSDTTKMLPNVEVMFGSMNGSANGGSIGLNVLKMVAGTPVATFGSVVEKITTFEVSITGLGANNASLISGTDYTIAITADGKATLSFTAAGLVKLHSYTDIDDILGSIHVKTTTLGGGGDSFYLDVSFANGISSATVDNILSNNSGGGGTEGGTDEPDVLVDANDLVQTSYFSKAFWDSGHGLDSQDVTKIFFENGVINDALYEKTSSLSPTGTMIGLALNNLSSTATETLLTFVNSDTIKAMESFVAPSLINIYKSDGTTMVAQMIKGVHYSTVVDATGRYGTFNILPAGEVFLKAQMATNGDLIFKLKAFMVDSDNHSDEISSYFYLTADKPAAPTITLLDANDLVTNATNTDFREKAFYDTGKEYNGTTLVGDFDDFDKAKIIKDDTVPLYEKASTLSPTGTMLGLALTGLNTSLPVLQFVNDSTMKHFDSLLINDKLTIYKADGTTQIGELTEGTHYTVSMNSAGTIGSFNLLPAGQTLLQTLVTANGDVVTKLEFTMVDGTTMHDQFGTYLTISANIPTAGSDTPPAVTLLDANDLITNTTDTDFREKAFYDSGKEYNGTTLTGDFDDFDKAKIIKDDTVPLYEKASTLSPTGTMMGLAINSLNTANPVFQFVNDNTMKVFESLLVADKLTIFKSDGTTQVGELIEGTHYSVSMNSAGKVGSFMMLAAGQELLKTLIAANGNLITKVEFTMVEGTTMHDQFGTYLYISSNLPSATPEVNLLDANNNNHSDPHWIELAYTDSSSADKEDVAKIKSYAEKALFEHQISSELAPNGNGNLIGLALNKLEMASGEQSIFEFVHNNSMDKFDSLTTITIDLFKIGGSTAVGQLKLDEHYKLVMGGDGKSASLVLLEAGSALLKSLTAENGDLFTNLKFTMTQGTATDEFEVNMMITGDVPAAVADTPTQFSMKEIGADWSLTDFNAEIRESQLPTNMAAGDTFYIGTIKAADINLLDDSELTFVDHNGGTIHLGAEDHTARNINGENSSTPISQSGLEIFLTKAGVDKLIAAGALNTGQNAELILRLDVKDDHNGVVHNASQEFKFTIIGEGVASNRETASAEDIGSANTTTETNSFDLSASPDVKVPPVTAEENTPDSGDVNTPEALDISGSPETANNIESQLSEYNDILHEILESFQSLTSNLTLQGSINTATNELISKLAATLTEFANKFGIEIPDLDITNLNNGTGTANKLAMDNADILFADFDASDITQGFEQKPGDVHEVYVDNIHVGTIAQGHFDLAVDSFHF